MVNDFEEKHGLKSELTLGFHDPKKHTGQLDWHPILFKYMYGIKLDDVKVNGQSLNLGCGREKRNCLATVDSGTSHLAMPGWAYKQLVGKIPLRSAGAPCADSEQFGELTYVINGKSYTIPNHDWTFEPEPLSLKHTEKNP